MRRAIRVVIDWFLGLFDGAAGEAISWWWYALALAALAVILAIVAWTLARVQRASRARRVDQGGVFEEAGVSAAQYLDRARSAVAAGDFSAAVLDAYRSLAADAVERFILDDRPGATAREIAQALASAYPHERDALGAAATVFGAVRYGDAHADRDSAERLLALRERIATAAPELEEVR